MKKIILLLALSSFIFTGCGLIPKNVEFFQSKVHKFPAFTPSQAEYQKQAAGLAKQKASETLDAALATGASTNVVAPARETEKLTDAVSTSLGPPVTPATNTDSAVANLQKAVAKLDQKIEAFKQESDKNAGKKIEGTGLISIPYFAYVGVIGLLIFVFWHLAKTALTVASAANPGAAVAVGGMNVAGSVAAKGVAQLVAGGEEFKAWVEKEVSDAGLKQKILDAFTSAHKTAQDGDVQAIVKPLVN